MAEDREVNRDWDVLDDLGPEARPMVDKLLGQALDNVMSKYFGGQG